MKKNEDIYCNMCGKKINREKELFTEEIFHAEKEWGYFSDKDGECHSFDLCEKCFDRLELKFKIPADVWETTTLI